MRLHLGHVLVAFAAAAAPASAAVVLRPGDVLYGSTPRAVFDRNPAVNPVAVYPSEGIVRVDQEAGCASRRVPPRGPARALASQRLTGVA